MQEEKSPKFVVETWTNK